MKKKPGTYSYSQISTFERCRRKYRFSYLSDVKPAFSTTVEAFMGSRVHEALEKLYADIGMTRVVSLDDLLSFYNARWDEEWDDSVHIVEKKDIRGEAFTANDYRKKGEQCLKNYYVRYAPFTGEKTLGLEMRFRCPLDEKRAVEGIIDRVAKKKDGTLVIHDYKTGSSVPTQEMIDNDLQLPLYVLGVREKWPGTGDVELVYHYLAKDEDLSPSRTGRRTAESVREDILARIAEIESASEFPPRPGVLCDWCEYRYACPAWEHEYEEKDLFNQQDHKDLVDEYAALWERREELDRDIEEVRRRILRYAGKSKGGSVQMKGSRHKIYVRAGKESGFPGKDDEGRAELEKFLKSSGKWEEVSILWLSFLKKGIESGRWDGSFVEELNSFRREKENDWVSKPYKLRKW